MKHSKICVFNKLTEMGYGLNGVEYVKSCGFGKDPLMTTVVKNLVLIFLCRSRS